MPSPTERSTHCGNRRSPDGSTRPARGSRPCGDLQGGARGESGRDRLNDLAAARTRSLRDVGISLAVLLVVTGLALALRRSITSPLREVSEAAQLPVQRRPRPIHVDYRGRDEIGDVVAAFRNLHVTVERLAKEIREMTAAVRHNRLEHRETSPP